MKAQTVNPSLHTFRSPKLQSVVAESIAFLLKTPIHTLPPASSFEGVGVYLLYYQGSFEYYGRIAAKNKSDCTTPIYVGKAVPLGWRTARVGRVPIARNLFVRLREHARSIDCCSNLAVDDFCCRFMILDGIETDLITAVEAHLVRLQHPLWNSGIDGFGNHDPGSGRYNQVKSEWDALHPGRPWVDRLTGQTPKLKDILSKIRELT